MRNQETAFSASDGEENQDCLFPDPAQQRAQIPTLPRFSHPKPTESPRMSLWTHISEHVAETTGAPFTASGLHATAGGCINRAHVLEGPDRTYFVKLNDEHRLPMFEAEAEGLTAIADTRTVRVPHPICCGTISGQAYLVMEHIQTAASRAASDAELGRQLADMHRNTRNHFGWHRDNTIGSTPQKNPPCSNWVDFWREQRLGYQLELAELHGYGGALQRAGQSLSDRLDEILHGHLPTPSLLHGDLWSGNHATDKHGNPFVFDPAVYYGDRETDIAMTELFGGFSTRFYSAYRESWPLNEGYSVRRKLYNVYHILNHLNLFGNGYHSQALHLIESLT